MELWPQEMRYSSLMIRDNAEFYLGLKCNMLSLWNINFLQFSVQFKLKNLYINGHFFLNKCCM